MIKKFLVLLIFFLFSNKLYAEDLVKTLSDAFKNNSRLNAERASLEASKQDVNISRGEFLPSITLSGDIASQEDSKRTNQTGTKLGDTSSTPESKSILVEQKIFDGFTNYNTLEKSKLEHRSQLCLVDAGLNAVPGQERLQERRRLRGVAQRLLPALKTHLRLPLVMQ